MFNLINEIRKEGDDIFTKYFTVPYVKWELNSFADNLKPFVWNEALALAARHVANEEGACFNG